MSKCSSLSILRKHLNYHSQPHITMKFEQCKPSSYIVVQSSTCEPLHQNPCLLNPKPSTFAPDFDPSTLGLNLRIPNSQLIPCPKSKPLHHSYSLCVRYVTSVHLLNHPCLAHPLSIKRLQSGLISGVFNIKGGGLTRGTGFLQRSRIPAPPPPPWRSRSKDASMLGSTRGFPYLGQLPCFHF